MSQALRRAIKTVKGSGLPGYQIALAVPGLAPSRLSQWVRGYPCDYMDPRILAVAALVGVPRNRAFLLDEPPDDGLPLTAGNGRADLRRHRRGPGLDMDGAGGAFFFLGSSLWSDPFFLDQPPVDRLVALFLLTAVGATVWVPDLAKAIGVEVPEARAALARVFDRFDWTGYTILDPDLGLDAEGRHV